jgi:hypothetical protein
MKNRLFILIVIQLFILSTYVSAMDEKDGLSSHASIPVSMKTDKRGSPTSTSNEMFLENFSCLPTNHLVWQKQRLESLYGRMIVEVENVYGVAITFAEQRSFVEQP